MDTRSNNPRQQRQDDSAITGMPARSNQPSSQSSSTPSIPLAPQVKNTPSLPSSKPEDLANMRQSYGFDDIPVDEDDMENVRFRDIFGAWAKQTIKHSELEDKAKQVISKKKRLNNLKNDLKWALQADLDEPVKPAVKPQQQTPSLVEQPKNHIVQRLTGARVAQQPMPPTPSDSAKTIDININFGSLPKLPTESSKKFLTGAATKLKAARLTKKHAVVFASVSVVIVASVLAWKLIPASLGAPSSGKSTLAANGSESPTYSTLLPSGKSVDSLGGWHRVSPPDKDAVFAYSDKIDNVQVNISQQPLPENFKADPATSITDLAKAYGATKKLEVGSAIAYLGTSIHGPQSAIVAKSNTLILMKSTQKINEDAWTTYIESLK